jgi:hypothetical protein
MSLLFRPSLLLCAMFLGLSASVRAQVCEESWEVDKTALRQVFRDINAFLAKPEPVVINLKAFGARAGVG